MMREGSDWDRKERETAWRRKKEAGDDSMEGRKSGKLVQNKDCPVLIGLPGCTLELNGLNGISLRHKRRLWLSLCLSLVSCLLSLVISTDFCCLFTKGGSTNPSFTLSRIIST